MQVQNNSFKKKKNPTTKFPNPNQNQPSTLQS
jgi:hypothetical protein